jgi:hypothetical protein
MSLVDATNTNQETKMTKLTTESMALFLKIAGDSGNWGGTPYVSISAEKRGNLTQCKRAKLLTTFESDGSTFAKFTPEGVALALENGIEV